jgi:hypothetical protein
LHRVHFCRARSMTRGASLAYHGLYAGGRARTPGLAPLMVWSSP